MDEVYSVAPGKDGRVWLATTYGLVKFQSGQFTTYTNVEAFRGMNWPRLRTVFEDSSGDVYLALDFTGLLTLRDGKYAPVPCVTLSGRDQRYINSFAEAPDGTLWMATPNGLLERRDGQCHLWTTTNGLSDNRTFGLAFAPDGAIWVGTRSAGLNEFRNGRFRILTPTNGLLSSPDWPCRLSWPAWS